MIDRVTIKWQSTIYKRLSLSSTIGSFELQPQAIIYTQHPTFLPPEPKMYAKAALGAAALAGFSLIQQAPAPVWTLIPGIASIVVNGISAHMDRRDLGDGSFEVKARIDQVPDLETRQGQSCFGPVREGVPQHIVDSCCGGLAGSHVTVTGGGDRGK